MQKRRKKRSTERNRQEYSDKRYNKDSAHAFEFSRLSLTILDRQLLIKKKCDILMILIVIESMQEKERKTDE